MQADPSLKVLQTPEQPAAEPFNRFTSWCSHELFTPTMIKAAKLLERACDLHLENLFRLHLAAHLETPKTATNLNSELGFIESASIALEAMLLRLAQRTELVRTEKRDGKLLFKRKQEGKEVVADLADIRQELTYLGSAYTAALDFIDFGAEHFLMALRDDPDFMDRVLSGREPRYQSLWDRATNEDPLQDAHGIMGARVIEELFASGRVLEIGGGTGNGARHLIQHFSALGRLHCLETYIFTDISLNFILTTRQKLMRAYPSVKIEWQTLDINRSFLEQKIPRQSIDLIYGVNAAHVARDVVEFLRECHATLCEGGKVVFAERVRVKGTEMAPRELTLNLSIYHRTAAFRNSEYRPVHCYLTPAGWLRVLELAGFRDSKLVPDIEALSRSFPDQYAAVVVGYK